MRRDIQTVELERARVGWSSVVSILMVVVLPAPFGPRNAKISPARTSNETSLTAMTLPNDFTMCWTRMIGRIAHGEDSVPHCPCDASRRARAGA